MTYISPLSSISYASISFVYAKEEYSLSQVLRPSNDGWNEAWFGGEKSDYDVIKDYAEVEAGDRRAWDEMMTLVAKGFAGEPEFQRLQGNNPDGTRNPTFPIYLDVDNFIDYMILHIYAGAEDPA